MTHFDEMTCIQYLEGLLERAQAREVSEHADECADCRALMRAIERESRMLVSAMREEDEPVPARLLAPVLSVRTPWAWILSFGMAAAGIYWLWSGVIGPWQEQISRAGFGETDLMTLMLFRESPLTWWESIWKFTQVMAAISIGGMGVFLLRRGWRRWVSAPHSAAIVMGALAVALAVAPSASAVEYHHTNQSYTLPAGSVVNDDLIVVSGNIRIDGEVNGDLFIAGASCIINGHVTGDVIIGGSQLRITGTVDGNLRGSTSLLEIRGKVGKNVTVFAGSIEMDPEARVGQDMAVYAGQFMMSGRIERNVSSRGGRVSLDGYVGGNITSRAEEGFVVNSGAEVKGAIKVSGQHQPEVEPGAKLASQPQFTYMSRRPSYTTGGYYWHQSLLWAAAFLFGLLWILVTPGLFGETVRKMENFSAIGFGALLLIATPILSVLICFSLIGIPIAITAVLLWFITMYAAKVFVCTWVGQKIMGVATSTGGVIARLALGLLLYEVAVEIPYARFWIWLIVTIWGLGALAIAVFDRWRLSSATLVAA